MSVGGLSKARLGRLRDVMARHVEGGDGIVTLVSRRGEVHVDAVGTKVRGAPTRSSETRSSACRR
jgi:hypothetical protein